ncbi:FAD-binding oxidoreductase [Salinispirillum sp. LH 10-3-1]|uniref:FAD-binding oxidoreductase n=1 Tax=Salinispirillum sp. LH 10-3-1 TaxID=2952525 RepID=A0AB38YCZ4_9GAMM
MALKATPSTAKQTIVLGAGIVGVSIAWHLAQRGRQVLLLDRRPPGQETSFGNAGIIQREAIAPYAFPRDVKTILKVLPNRRIDIRYRPTGMVAAANPLFSYWLNSLPYRYRKIVPEYGSIIALCTDEHDPMIQAANAQHLVQKKGWLQLYRTRAAFDKAMQEGEQARTMGAEWEALTRTDIDHLQPGLSSAITGAIHWQNSWTVQSPGELVQAYARHAESLGVVFAEAELRGITPAGSGWHVTTSEGDHSADEVVVALGPWSQQYLAPLGYAFPLFVKRGYHMHYHQPQAKHEALNYWLMDSEKGYLLEPMKHGIRLTTGAELANLEAPPSYSQLDAAEREARKLFAIGERADPTPWKGARPCLPDMKPIIGAAPKHRGLWLAFGHGHQGFTLGPPTGRLLAEMMTGEPTTIDMQPFRAERFR